MMILTTKLGIGTDAPTTELDVAGGNIAIRNGSGALAERNVIRTNGTRWTIAILTTLPLIIKFQ